jgi:Nickel responsive protein SCO4226-like
MRLLISLFGSLLLTPAFGADAAGPSVGNAPDGNGGTAHRYLIERTFPPGALAGLDAATKAKVNANNATVGASWVRSYANADETRTYCVYEGPNEAAIREAARLNALPVDRITEVPVDLDPGTPARASAPAVQSHRFVVEGTFPPGALRNLDAAARAKVNETNARYGVRWVTSYASADRTRGYWIYEGPSESAVRNAALAGGAAVDSVMEIPLTLLPR